MDILSNIKVLHKKPPRRCRTAVMKPYNINKVYAYSTSMGLYFGTSAFMMHQPIK